MFGKKPTQLRPRDDTGISHKLKVSYFVASIIPILVMTYLYLKYISPEVFKEGQDVIAIVVAVLMLLTISLSVMGLMLTSRAANDSIHTLQKLNNRMDSLLDLTKNFRESMYVDVLLDSIANSASQILNAEASSILLYDEAGNLRFEHITGESANALKGKIVKPGVGITGWVAQEGKPVVVNDVASDPRFASMYDKDSGFVTRSMLCVPLVIEGVNIGILEVINK
ncbi:MAG: GAF domain-containing protein [Nitrospirae bacterium]|nr:GAF domain-containing protein [Nitrospirota bacterium]